MFDSQGHPAPIGLFDVRHTPQIRLESVDFPADDGEKFALDINETIMAYAEMNDASMSYLAKHPRQLRSEDVLDDFYKDMSLKRILSEMRFDSSRSRHQIVTANKYGTSAREST